MRYSLLAGGKRVRPVLALATAEAIEIDPDTVLSLAAAIELIHTYSLIHDDLPAMDDDALRRGRPTNHVAFGEDVAILAGDGLFAEAMRLVVEQQEGPPDRVLAALAAIVDAAGVGGMVGGQYLDVTVGEELDATALRHLHASAARHRRDRRPTPTRTPNPPTARAGTPTTTTRSPTRRKVRSRARETAGIGCPPRPADLRERLRAGAGSRARAGVACEGAGGAGRGRGPHRGARTGG